MKNIGWKFILVGVISVLVGLGLVTSTSLPQEEIALVKRAIDGDTIELADGRRVRYLGINTPELATETKPIQCYAQRAFEKNSSLVNGKVIRMVRDVSDLDTYGRLLRYAWVNDTFVNEYLVKEGYAQVMGIPPDTYYYSTFKNDQREAKELSRGLWGGCPSTNNTVRQ